MATFTVSKRADRDWIVVDEAGTEAGTFATRREANAEAEKLSVASGNGSGEAVDYTSLSEKELATKAKADHASATAAKKAGETIPATPYLDELNRRYAGGSNPASKRSKAEKGKGNGTGRQVRLDDADLQAALTELVEKHGVTNRAQAVKALRDSGRGSNQQRVARAWQAMVDGGVKVPEATTTKKAAPAKAAKATTRKSTARKSSSPSPKQIGLAANAQKAVSERRRTRKAS